MSDRPPTGTTDSTEDSVLDLTHEPDLGYVFYPSEIPDHPGHPRLDVIIPGKPTERHYDPQRAQFYLLLPTGDAEQISIHHPWGLAQFYRVCPGLIVLTDRRGKRVEAFSFGGDLQILSEQDQTVCALSSSAPIFPLFTPLDLPMWIVCEVEILLAQQEAHWDRDHHRDFKAKLGEVDPFLIYLSCLQALHVKDGHIHCGDKELDRQGRDFVESEIERIKQEDAWPLLLPTLDQLS